MAPAHSRIVRYESPDSDGSYERVPGRTPSPEKTPPPGLLPIAECQARLRKSISLIPLKLFRRWRGGTIDKILCLLIQQIENNDKSHQNIHKDMMGKLENRTNKPDDVEFKAFWLHQAGPLTLQQREHLEEAGWQDLAAWIRPHAEGGNTDSDKECVYMQSADLHAVEELSETQHIWRQRLMLVRVEGFTQDDMGNWTMLLDKTLTPSRLSYNGPFCQKWIDGNIDGWTDYIMRTLSPHPSTQSTANAPSAPRPKTTTRSAPGSKAAASSSSSSKQPAANAQADDQRLTLEDVVEGMASMQASLQEQTTELQDLREYDRGVAEESHDRDRRQVAALAKEVAELKDKLAKLEGANNKRKQTDDDAEDERRVKARRFLQGLKDG